MLAEDRNRLESLISDPSDDCIQKRRKQRVFFSGVGVLDFFVV